MGERTRSGGDVIVGADLAYVECRRRQLRSMVGTVALKWNREATMMVTSDDGLGR